MCNGNYCTLFEQVSHVRNAHSTGDFKFSCGIEGCSSEFSKTNSYYKHVRKDHFDEYFTSTDKTALVSNSSQRKSVENDHTSEEIHLSGDEYDNQQVGENVDFHEDYDVLPNKYQESYQKDAALHLLRLKSSHNLSQRALDDVISANSALVSAITEHIKVDVSAVLQSSGINSELCEQVESIIESHGNPFKDLQSAYLQKKFLTTNFPYVVSFYILHVSLYICYHACLIFNKEPVCIELGKHLGIIKSRGNSSLDNISDSFYYVPILGQLEVLLQNDIIRSQVKHAASYCLLKKENNYL